MVHKLNPSDTVFSNCLCNTVSIIGSSESFPSSKDITSAKYCVIQSFTTKIPVGIHMGWEAEHVNALYASYLAGTSGTVLFLLHSQSSFNSLIYCELQNRRVLFFNPPVVPTNLR